MARVDLQRTRIHAPFDARIAAVSVAPGDRVRVGDALADVFDPRAIELRAQVPSGFLALLRNALNDGHPALASAMVDDARVRARLDRLSARIERGHAGADALFSVDRDVANTLELGRTVQLSVSLPAVDDVVPIPAEALYGVDQIYLLIDSRMQAITVQRIGDFVDADGAHRLLVKSEQISAGTEIIVTQLPSAVDGLKVQVAQ
jgi:multidrug efflux pump subunit AcrA (membrane-fusion protein)